jgi:hypothetical protein
VYHVSFVHSSYFKAFSPNNVAVLLHKVVSGGEEQVILLDRLLVAELLGIGHVYY